jgi:hypothetical protein
MFIRSRIQALFLQLGNFGGRGHGALLQSWKDAQDTAAQQRCQAKKLGSDSNFFAAD